MSEYALIIGVQNYLRSFNIFDEKNCGAQINETPQPVIGDFYVTIYPLGIQPAKFDDSQLIEEVYTIGLTVSKIGRAHV